MTKKWFAKEKKENPNRWHVHGKRVYQNPIDLFESVCLLFLYRFAFFWICVDHACRTRTFLSRPIKYAKYESLARNRSHNRYQMQNQNLLEFPFFSSLSLLRHQYGKHCKRLENVNRLRHRQFMCPKINAKLNV